MNIPAISFGCDCKKDDKKVSNYAKGGFAAGAGLVGIPLTAISTYAASTKGKLIKDLFSSAKGSAGYREMLDEGASTIPKALKPIYNFISKPLNTVISKPEATEKEVAKLAKSFKGRIAIASVIAIAAYSTLVGGIGAGIAATTGAISKAIDKK